MKKLLIFPMALPFAIVLLSSCGGGSVESDAKKLAQLQCDALELVKEAELGDYSVIEKSAKLTAEAEALSRELESKYTSESDKQKLAEALSRELGKCK